jgi:YD repeat-containing protein
MSRASLSGRSHLLVCTVAVALLATVFGSQPANSFATPSPNRNQEGRGEAGGRTGKLVARYTTADSDTYELANGHMLTHVYEQAVNYKDAAGQWQALSGPQSTNSSQSPAPISSVSPAVKRSEQGVEDEVACTLISSAPTTSACNQLTFKAGFESSTSASERTLIQFALPALRTEMTLLYAQLELYETSSTTTKPVPMGAYRVTTPWTSGATWATSNGSTPWGTPGGDYANPVGEAETSINPAVGTGKGWEYWYPTKMVQQWYNGPQAPAGQSEPALGFLLKDVAEGEVNNVVSFYGREKEKDAPGLLFEWVQRGLGNATNYTMLPIQLSSTSSLKVNAASGNLLANSTDISVPSKGLEFVSARTWNSLPNEDGDYGSGWTDSNAVHLYIEPGGSVAYTDSTGTVFPFIKQGSNFASPPGIEATLCAAGSAAPCPASLPKKTLYQLIYTSTQTRINFKTKKSDFFFIYPLDVEDSAGETQTANYAPLEELPTSWTDTEGTDVAYTYSQTLGVWTKITDEGNHASTSYQYKNDGLSEYKNPGGESTGYSYGTAAEGEPLTQITEADGTTTKLTYNSARQVTKIVILATGQTTGPTTTYTYYEVGKAPAPCTATQKATVVAETYGNNEPTITYCANVFDEVESTNGYPATGQTGWYSLEEESDSESAAASVNVAGGDLMVESEDVPSEEASAGVRLDRYYNSQATTRAGGLGPRWSWDSGPDVYLRNLGATVVLHGPSGDVVTLNRQSSTAYSGPEGLEGILTKNENGSYTLAGVDAVTYQFNSLGVMTSYADEAAQTFTASDTTTSGVSVLRSLSPAAGKPLELTYNTTPRVTQTTDPAGKVRHYEYNATGELATYINSAGERTEYGYNPASSYLDKITTPNGTVESITIGVGAKVSELTVARTGEATRGEKFVYEAPAGPTCNPASDAGETVVTHTPAVEGEVPATYCYSALGAITGYSGPEGEVEKDATEGSPIEQEELPAGTCYPNPAFPANECGQNDPPPENEEAQGELANATLGVQPLASGSIPDLGPTHYGIADQHQVNVPGSFNIFTNSYFEALHVVNVRRVIPWNTVWEAENNPSNTRAAEELVELKAWVKDVKALGGNTGQPTVSFGYCGEGEAKNSWLNPLKPTEAISCDTAPTEAQYEPEIKAFLETAPLSEVKYFTPWNEPNRREKNAPAPGEPKGEAAGEYWRALDEVCDSRKPKCEVAAGDFLDTYMTDANDNHTSNEGGTYYEHYVKGMGHGETAHRWAWHAYSEGEWAGRHYFEPSKWWSAFKNFHNAVDRTTHSTVEPDIWLTEQGVLYEVGGKETEAGENGTVAQDIMRAFVEDGEHQLTRQSRQITRFFYYEMRGASGFDTGLLALAGSPRAIYDIYKKKTLGD